MSLLQCPPPRRLIPANNVQLAFISSLPKFAVQQRRTGKRLKGILYERKVHEYLCEIDELYIPGFWVNFLADAGWKYCQPDGLRIDVDSGTITLVEIKYQHTSDAWWQLKSLYFPVIEKLFPRDLWNYEFCEIVKWYDCATPFPEVPQLVANPFQPSESFKVHIWRP